MKKIPRDDRISIGFKFYGMYLLGMAATENDMVDEDCCMDNMRVPYYQDQLTDAHKQYLAELSVINSDEAIQDIIHRSKRI